MRLHVLLVDGNADMMAKFFSWQSRPSDIEIRNHTNQFFMEISNGNSERAFFLCPIYTWSKTRPHIVLDSTNTDAVLETMGYIFDEIEGYGALDEHMTAKKIGRSDVESWCHFIGIPENFAFESYNLDVPENEEDEGEVLVNVYVDGAVTDITSFFHLIKQDSQWLLAFKMFKVM